MEIWTAFVLGLGGSLHCVSMCGPLVLALPGGQQRRRFVLGRLLYSAGRLTTYAVLGGLFGLLGGAVHLAGWQQAVSLGLGILLLGAAGLWLGRPLFRLTLKGPTAVLGRAIGTIKAQLGRLFGMQSLKALFAIGLLNGLLPCGFVYLALAASLTAAGPLEGMAYMALFGAGTVPALLAIGLARQWIGDALKQWSLRLMPAGMALVGALLLVRGMALDIPYLSPVLGLAVKACH
jgi:uncharacterized protein